MKNFNHDCRFPASELFALFCKAYPYKERISAGKIKIKDFSNPDKFGISPIHEMLYTISNPKKLGDEDGI